MPPVTRVCLGWIATRPLNRFPNTKTGQIRNAPPAAKSATPTQRIVSPSIVHRSLRSVYAGRYALRTPIITKTGRTHRLPRVSRTPTLRFPPAKEATTDSANRTTTSATNAGWEKNDRKPPQPSTARPAYAQLPIATSSNLRADRINERATMRLNDTTKGDAGDSASLI